MVFCSSWHSPCSVVKQFVSVVLGNFVLVNFILDLKDNLNMELLEVLVSNFESNG